MRNQRFLRKSSQSRNYKLFILLTTTKCFCHTHRGRLEWSGSYELSIVYYIGFLWQYLGNVQSTIPEKVFSKLKL